MKRQLRSISCIVVMCHALFAPNGLEAKETDPEKKLLEEVVKFKSGKMSIQEFGLLSFPWAPDEKIQLRLRSEAPESGVVSRDNFVGITAVLQTVVLFGIAMEAQSSTGAAMDLRTLDDVFEYVELDEPIGNVDLEINLYMSKGGLQMEFVNTRENSTQRNTVPWKDLLK